jgi:hypothetical protein
MQEKKSAGREAMRQENTMGRKQKKAKDETKVEKEEA